MSNFSISDSWFMFSCVQFCQDFISLLPFSLRKSNLLVMNPEQRIDSVTKLDECFSVFPLWEKPYEWPPHRNVIFLSLHILSANILTHHLYTALWKMALSIPVLNGQLWTVNVSYHVGLHVWTQTHSPRPRGQLQCPVCNNVFSAKWTSCNISLQSWDLKVHSLNKFLMYVMCIPFKAHPNSCSYRQDVTRSF